MAAAATATETETAAAAPAATAAYRCFLVLQAHCCCCCSSLLCAAARTYARASLTLSSFVLFDVVVVNCSSLLSCTLHNAPLITAEWEKERRESAVVVGFR